jgi:methylenetetrahydrofolate reductase (NADH)
VESSFRAVQNLLSNYSIETTVHQAEHIARFTDIVASGTRIYIPYTPGTTFENAVELSARLRREGMEPVPHVVARRIQSLSVLEDFFARLAGEAGVVQVLVVAGDTAKPAGSLDSSLQVLDSGLLEKYKITTIGVAGHPEGHPSVSDNVLRQALKQKNAYAERTGAGVYIVTQFTFSATPVIAWERSHGADIRRLPVTVGLPGLASAKTLLKYALECGVGASLEAFSKHYSSFTKLLTVSAPNSTILALARHRLESPQTRIAGVHFFTFGGFERTAEWANAIVHGDFELTDAGLRTLR